jgi:hypothetical protein
MNPVKKFRVVIFDIFVEKSFVVVEDETLVCIAKVDGCSELGQGFSSPLLPLPEPDRVEMGVTDHVELPHVSLLNGFLQSSIPVS